jgi:hypothetical protein
MKKLQSILGISMLPLLSLSSYAQDLESAEDSNIPFLTDEGPAAFSNKAEKSANTYITDEKNWQIGFNPDGRYVVVGKSGISIAPTRPGYQASRSNAYDKAMLNAKEQVAKFYALEVAQEIVNSFGEVGNKDANDTYNRYTDGDGAGGVAAPNSNGIVDKMKSLVTAELNERLDAKGIDPESGLAKAEVAKMLEMKKEAPNVDSYDVFRKSIERAAQAEVGALAVSKIFEDSGNIAVVATYSNATKQLAAAFNGVGVAPKVSRNNRNLQKWANNLSTKDVYSAFGVQLTSDSDGNLVMLSYAQATAKRDTALAAKNAYSAAEASADGNIRSFIGESVAYKGALKQVEANEEGQGLDEMGEVVGKLAQSREQRNQVSAKSGALKIPGITTIKRWSTTDKRSGTTIVGVVKMCSMGTAQAANRERESFDAIGGSRGGEGMSNQGTSNQGTSGSNGKQSSGDSSYGTMSAEQSSGYSHESMESEDF